MAKSVEMRICKRCGEEYPRGLYDAHRLVSHKRTPQDKDPDRLFKCRICRAKYPASKVEQHRRTVGHRETGLVRLPYDPIVLATAYIRGDRVRDILKSNRTHAKQLYRALHLCDVPLRGSREPEFQHVEQRDFLARTRGNRWRRIRSMRAQGKSWIEIERAIAS